MEQKSYEPTAAFNPPLMDFFAKSFQSCLTLCDPMDCSLLSSSVRGILQARILEWVAFPSPGDLPDPEIKLCLLFSQVGSLLLSHRGSPLPWEGTT